MNYEEMYLEESKQFNSVVKRFEKLQENREDIKNNTEND